ncbi:MAG: alpha/beta hydrolase [Solirubrobacterales bacterium]|nr:alpha/beta hydrolase [Solirubrobacterales bacterium]
MTVNATTTSRVLTSEDGTTIGYETLGAGDGLLVIGGAWRSGRDYLAFAEALSTSFTVHLIDRRGRGRSGAQGPAYSIARETEDLLAAQAQTGARIVFGHSYGGLIALEAARGSNVFSDVIVYEPGVSIAGSIPLGWMLPYRERLEAGDLRGAFAAMVRGAGGAPPAMERMPLWYIKLVLRLLIRGQRWRHIEALLHAGLAEHQQVQALDRPTVERYRTTTARVHLLGGGKSSPQLTTRLFEAMQAVIPNCTSEVIPGLDHLAPDDKAPTAVAEHVLCQLREHAEPAAAVHERPAPTTPAGTTLARRR